MHSATKRLWPKKVSWAPLKGNYRTPSRNDGLLVPLGKFQGSWAPAFRTMINDNGIQSSPIPHLWFSVFSISNLWCKYLISKQWINFSYGKKESTLFLSESMICKKMAPCIAFWVDQPVSLKFPVFVWESNGHTHTFASKFCGKKIIVKCLENWESCDWTLPCTA